MAVEQGTSTGALTGSAGGLDARLRAAVALRLGDARFGLWFGEGVRLGFDAVGEALEVGVPNAFFREWIEGHFADNLIEAGQSVAGRPLRLTFHIDDEAEPRIGHVIDPTRPDGRPQKVVKVPKPSGPGPFAPPPTVQPLPPTDRPRMAAATPKRLASAVVL